MDRRELLKAGAVGLLPFTGHSLPRINEQPTGKSRICEYCGKEVAWKESMLMETTAHNYDGNDRTYCPVGMVIFHMDGTRCSVEFVNYTRLEEPIVHKNYKPTGKRRKA